MREEEEEEEGTDMKMKMLSDAYPGDVVVSVHYAEHRVDDEEEQEQQPVGNVLLMVALHVGWDESAEGYDCRGL
jgi:hypothetical protein